MLKRFFLNILSSFVGTWIALVLFGVVATLVCIGIIAKLGFGSSSSAPSVEKGTMLTINLNGPIEERETPESPDYLTRFVTGMERENVQTLVMLKEAIAAAGENKNISGIYLKCNGAVASPATLNALRNSLIDFKKTGKTIIAYSEGYTMGDYYVATAADLICMNPYGNVKLQGIGGTVIYYKPLLDKIGVNMQVVKVGTYKSAVEPYILPEMSRPARAQLDTLYGSMWNVIKEAITEKRGFKSPSVIDTLINQDFISLLEGNDDLKNNLVDALYFERSMDSLIAKKIGRDKDKLNFVGPSVLVDQEFFSGTYVSSNQIPVLFASGEIVDGGGNQVIDYEKFVPIIIELADNDNVKGMVLRVNSPGGSVFGSEQIGDALDYFQSKGKPLAVSMGDYAASGGYWISSCADRIFANPLTITGSIGIFGLIPDLSPLLEKIGVRPQLVSTNPEAAFPSLFYPMTERQHAAMQKMIEHGYDKFVARVAKGRNLSEAKVREIGEGRVWSAGKAKEIGLVDEFGDLQDAINWVAEKASLKNYDSPYYPTVESNVWSYINQIGGMNAEEILKEKLGEQYTPEIFNFFQNLIGQKPLQARIPKMNVRFCGSSDFYLNY